uniref:uncharacterized protein LOC122583015 n=1 Tax=Erigeron canadensis TaxID=72917 RepID=UPI001CB99615|nr:uncharacterized protein LOC122583015 [Erigeron canadensis]
MVIPVSLEEIKDVMFSIGDNKAPGPDGFTSAFFKKSWRVIGDEVSSAIQDFFVHGRLLQEVNHTILALIPKVSTPATVFDYRPISCCNVIYKCISKIITNRSKPGLDTLVSINQSAFIPGRKISDNILLTQELMHNYHLNRGPPRCAFKIDIHKAYDTVSWDFLRENLVKFDFHQTMVNWIMACVTSVSYSLSINGDLHGYFKGKRGLRQGDPMSPYLFTLVMEVLSLLFQRASLENPFKFHAQCNKQKIISVCFADDLFLFARGDINSTKTLMDVLNHFQRISGLSPSLTKSTAFFCSIADHTKQAILAIMPFDEGKLPVRYLGVPLISTRLGYKDCKVLVERMEKRIDDWKTKTLSFAGRLHIINSVLASMHIYWASIFILPARVIKELEQKMRNFLWGMGPGGKVKSKASWKSVCLPKYEGGLGIKRISNFNKALITSHIWSIVTDRESLWVRWIHSYKLKGRNFWDVTPCGSMSWGWRKILLLRDTIRPYIWKNIGNGLSTLVWNDTWNERCPLRNFISTRDIMRAGFRLDSNITDVLSNDQWTWPQEWYNTYPVLDQIHPPMVHHNIHDRTVWKDLDGVEQEFSVSEVWNDVRYKQDKVPWVNSVWFSTCVPRHAFHLWLVFHNKLKTQDRLKAWEVGSATNLNLMCCPFCQKGIDSRSHLFFQCSFSLQVWGQIKHMANMSAVVESWDSIARWLISRSSSTQNSAESVIARLLVAAASYFLWLERNSRLFSNTKCSEAQVREKIMTTVRLKLLSLKFKATSSNRQGDGLFRKKKENSPAPFSSLRNGSTIVPSLASEFNKGLGSHTYVPPSVGRLRDDASHPAHARALAKAMTPLILALEHDHRSLDDLNDKLNLYAYHAVVVGASYRGCADAKIEELSGIISMLKSEREAHLEEDRVYGDKLKLIMEENDKENARLSCKLNSKSISLGERERELAESQAEVEKLRGELAMERSMREELSDSSYRGKDFIDAFPDLFRGLLSHSDVLSPFKLFNQTSLLAGLCKGSIKVFRWIEENAKMH